MLNIKFVVIAFVSLIASAIVSLFLYSLATPLIRGSSDIGVIAGFVLIFVTLVALPVTVTAIWIWRPRQETKGDKDPKPVSIFDDEKEKDEKPKE